MEANLLFGGIPPFFKQSGFIRQGLMLYFSYNSGCYCFDPNSLLCKRVAFRPQDPHEGPLAHTKPLVLRSKAFICWVLSGEKLSMFSRIQAVKWTQIAASGLAKTCDPLQPWQSVPSEGSFCQPMERLRWHQPTSKTLTDMIR